LAQPDEILLDIGTTARRVETAADAAENGVVWVPEAVVNPAAFAPLGHEAGVLQDFEITADVGLRLGERIDQLAHTRAAVSYFEQTAREPHPAAISQGGERRLWGN
jgi:hypothetical protein